MVRQAIGRLLPNKDDFKQCLQAGAARHRHRRDPRHPARQRRGARAVRRPTRSRRSSPRIRSRFGRGAIEGVAGPESANNAGAQTSFIPLLTLGIPPNAVMALMVGAMTIHGIIPGPAGDDQEPGPVLGHDRLDVDRQPAAARHQPAAGRPLGAALESAVPPDVPGDPDVLLHRHLLDQLAADRRHVHRLLRLRGLRC